MGIFSRRDFFKLSGVAPFLKLGAQVPVASPSSGERGSELALVNAKILTMEREQPEAEAALVRGGRIVLVGSNDRVRVEASSALTFDAAGRVVVPGFVDAHCHFEMTCLAASYQAACHTPPLASLRQILDVLGAKARETPPGKWVIGRGSFALAAEVVEKRLATRQDLDAVTQDHPLVLFAGFHVAMLNTRALKEFGLWDPDAKPPRGSIVHREPSGAPTGVATEVWDLLPPYSFEEVRTAVKAQARELFVSKGTTSISTIPYSADDIRADRELQAAGELPLRLRIYYHVPHAISLDALLATGLISGAGDDMFRLGGIKIFVDGTAHDGLGNPVEDYKWTQEELSDFVSRAHAAGIQLIMHVLSRGALLMAATAVEEALRRNPRPHRHRVEHGGDHLDRLEDMRRLRELGIRVVTTPHFGRRRRSELRTPRFRTLIEEGLEPIAVTDATGTVPGSSSPLFNMACAVAARGEGGGAPGPEEAVTFEEALRMHTLWAAHGGFEEQDKGSIAAGKLGDFAVLSEDPRGRPGRELFDLKVDATILGGEVVYEREPSAVAQAPVAGATAPGVGPRRDEK